MKKCLFCGIANREVNARFIFENEENAAFLDIHPCSPGHTVVIPKSHKGTILNLTQKEGGSLFEAVRQTASIIQNSLKPDGFTIGINHGRRAGQAIEHLHIHLIPRYKEDGGGSIHTIVNYKTGSSLDFIESKIKEI